MSLLKRKKGGKGGFELRTPANLEKRRSPYSVRFPREKTAMKGTKGENISNLLTGSSKKRGECP